MLKQFENQKLNIYPQYSIEKYTTEQLLGLYIVEQECYATNQYKIQFRPRRHQNRLLTPQSFDLIMIEEWNQHQRQLSTVEEILDPLETTEDNRMINNQEYQIPNWIVLKMQIENIFGQWLNNNCQNVMNNNYNLNSETLMWLINVIISYSKDQQYITQILYLIKQIYDNDIYNYLSHRIIYIFSQNGQILCGDLINIYLNQQQKNQIDQQTIYQLQKNIYNKIKQKYEQDNILDELWIDYISEQQILLINILPQINLEQQDRITFNNILAQKDQIDISQQLKSYMNNKDIKDQFLGLTLASSYNQDNDELKQCIEKVIIKDFSDIMQDTFQSQIKQNLINQYYKLYPSLTNLFDKYQQQEKIQQNLYLELYDVDKLIINKNYYQISQIQEIQTLIIPEQIRNIFEYDTVSLKLIDMFSNEISVEKMVQSQQEQINYRLKLQSSQEQDIYFLLYNVTLKQSSTNQEFNILNISNPQLILKQAIEAIESQNSKQNNLMFSQVECYEEKPKYIINFSTKKPQFQIQYLNNQQNTYYEYCVLNLCFQMKFQFRGSNEVMIKISKNCKVSEIQLLYIDDQQDGNTTQLKTNYMTTMYDDRNYQSITICQDKYFQLQGRNFYIIIQGETTYDDILIDFFIKNQEKEDKKQIILKSQPLLDVQYKIINNQLILQYDIADNKSSYTIQQAKLYLNEQLYEYANDFQLIKEQINQNQQKIKMSYLLMSNDQQQQENDQIRYALEQIIRYSQIEIYQNLIQNKYIHLIDTQLKQLQLYTVQFLVSSIQDQQIIKLQPQQFTITKLVKQEKTKENDLLLTYEIIYLKPGYYIYPKLFQQSIQTIGCDEQKPVFIKVVE